MDLTPVGVIRLRARDAAAPKKQQRNRIETAKKRKAVRAFVDRAQQQQAGRSTMNSVEFQPSCPREGVTRGRGRHCEYWLASV
jgi:hypothetical protein